MKRCCGHVPRDLDASFHTSGYFIPAVFLAYWDHSLKYHSHPPVKPNRRRTHRRRA